MSVIFHRAFAPVCLTTQTTNALKPGSLIAMTTTVAVAGATGRLGRLVCEIVEQIEGFELVSKLTSMSTQADYEALAVDVLVDVTHPGVSEGIVTAALSRGINVLVGTSGWSAEKIAQLDSVLATAPEATGVIVVPNFSLGSVLGTALAAAAAPYFDSVEIVETHHAGKVDSPSGTAVRTAEQISAARAAAASPRIEAPNSDQPARGDLIAGIPVHSLRLPGAIAKQEVQFSGEGESLSIIHDTTSSDAYRAGIRAALRVIPAATGVTVGLDSVLGINL